MEKLKTQGKNSRSGRIFPRLASQVVLKKMPDVKGDHNDSLALVSSPEVACGFRYDPNHCVGE